MTDPRRTDVRAALVHLEAVDGAIRRAVVTTTNPASPVRHELVTAGGIVDELRGLLERVARQLDPDAADRLTRRADEAGR